MTAHMFLVFSWVAAAATVVEILVIVKVLRSIFKKQKQHPARMAISSALNTHNE